MSIPYGHDNPDSDAYADEDGLVCGGEEEWDEHVPDSTVRVVPFPEFDSAALQGTAGAIVRGILPYTEAHPAGLLVHLLARFGATVGNDSYVRAANEPHPPRLNVLVVGKTSDGAKGTSASAVNAVFDCAEKHTVWMLRRHSGLSTGEGLMELVRDGNGKGPDSAGFDEGEPDKRLYIEDPEFASTLTVMERTGNSLPRVIREAWDGRILRSSSRQSPLIATGAHIVIAAHVTPGELRIKLSDAQLFGGTMNRFLPVASRRTKMRPDGGNIPESVLEHWGEVLRERIDKQRLRSGEVTRTNAARDVWHESYAYLQRSRPDGPVASILGRAVPQVLRLSLTYALLDGRDEIDAEHLSAALALWSYVESTAEWMFREERSPGEFDRLVTWIAAAGEQGRTRKEISVYFQRNKTKEQLNSTLAPLIEDGRIKVVTDSKTGPGPKTKRYVAT